MALGDYFKAQGKKAMGKVKDAIGSKKGEETFQTSANKHRGKFGPSDNLKKKHGIK